MTTALEITVLCTSGKSIHEKSAGSLRKQLPAQRRDSKFPPACLAVQINGDMRNWNAAASGPQTGWQAPIPSSVVGYCSGTT